jgi:Amiloride-sensitive sodium channel
MLRYYMLYVLRDLFVDCCIVVQSQSLEYPFGNCKDSQRLRYFGENVTYTVPKCRLECETDELVRACNCTDAHMPGNEVSFRGSQV